jgi:putative SOS response-associated peptidase YedK
MGSFKPETYPGYMAPIIRLAHDQPEKEECVAACFGMVPHWADLKLARQTYNARTETVATKPSYRNAFKNRQFCIIPTDSFYEPCYETGKAVRWNIAHAKDRPIGVAGIWEWRANGSDGQPLISFSMLTINADGHPLMQRFHKPEDEKRMLVILEPQQYQAWLHAAVEEAPSFFVPYLAEQLVAVPAPKPPSRKLRPDDLFRAA